MQEVLHRSATFEPRCNERVLTKDEMGMDTLGCSYSPQQHAPFRRSCAGWMSEIMCFSSSAPHISPQIFWIDRPVVEGEMRARS